MKYILIVWIISWYAGGSTSAEFNDLKSCQTAGRIVENSLGVKNTTTSSVRWVCVEKGNDK